MVWSEGEYIRQKNRKALAIGAIIVGDTSLFLLLQSALKTGRLLPGTGGSRSNICFKQALPQKNHCT